MSDAEQIVKEAMTRANLEDAAKGIGQGVGILMYWAAILMRRCKAKRGLYMKFARLAWRETNGIATIKP